MADGSSSCRRSVQPICRLFLTCWMRDFLCFGIASFALALPAALAGVLISLRDSALGETFNATWAISPEADFFTLLDVRLLSALPSSGFTYKLLSASSVRSLCKDWKKKTHINNHDYYCELFSAHRAFIYASARILDATLLRGSIRRLCSGLSSRV